MKKNKIIIGLLFMIIGFTTRAQQNPTLCIQATVRQGKVEISWFPTDPSAWKEGLKTGYTLTRETVGSSTGNFTPYRSVLKDSLWFKSNAGESVLTPIGQILYSNQFLSRTNMENDALQYNYLVYESKREIRVAQAIGLGYIDQQAIANKTYRYVIKHNKTGQSNSITIRITEGEWVQEPKEYMHDFQWPNGNSLSDMLEMSKPFELEAILGKARPKMDSVLLRWAPTTMNICRMAMEDGYEIWKGKGDEAMTLVNTVKPWTEAQLRNMPRQDTFALLAAAYVLDRGIPQDMGSANLFDQAAMETNYFGFALSAADRSVLAAEVLGLYYVDKDVILSEIYRYEIRSKRHIPKFPIPEIWVTNELEILAAPENFRIQKNEKSVTLSWRPNTDVQYGSYIIERKNPGDTLFHPLTREPIVFIRDAELKNNPYTYVDNLPLNNQVFHYRIKGSNAFGEWSDYAYGNGFGRDLTPPGPVSLVSGNFISESKNIRISWTPNTLDKDLKYHQVLVADHPQSTFAAISNELSPSDTAYVMNLNGMDIDQSFYFIVNSVDSSGNISSSQSRFVFVPDYDRPEAPETIHAKIGPEGWVTVSWSRSKSKDVVGYYVFFANSEPNNLALVYDKPLNDTIYSWKLELNSLTKNIYVGVKSEDDNYNRSFLTEILEVRRPDTIAPVKPLILSLQIKNDQVEILWSKSSSSDVVKYYLFRKSMQDSLPAWMLIDSLDSEYLSYYDSNAPLDKYVQYSLKAVDDFNNLSDYSSPAQLFVPFPDKKFVPVLKQLEVGKNQAVQLNWQFGHEPIEGKKMGYSYEIFRSVGSEQVSLYKELNSSIFNLEDSQLEKNVLYNYAVRVKYENGWTGALSEIKSIQIK